MGSSEGQTRRADPLEDQLLSQARAGDAQAFASLLKEHDDKMRGLAWKVLGDGDRDAMDDVLQDAYLKAFRSVSRFRGDASFSTWLYRITYTTCIDHHRREKRRRHVDFDRVENVKAAPNMSVEGPSRSVTDRLVVQRALSTLSDDHRSILLLVDGEGLSYLEAAEVMGIAPGTVASRLARARTALRRALGSDPEGVAR